MSLSRVPWLRWLTVAVAFTILCSGAALAQTAAVERGKSGEAELRQPTPAEIRKLTDQMPSASEEFKDLKSAPLPGGGEVIDLKGRFQNAVLAVRNADGSVSTTCVTNKDEAKKFLKSKAAVKHSHKTAKAQPHMEVQ